MIIPRKETAQALGESRLAGQQGADFIAARAKGMNRAASISLAALVPG